MKIASAFTALGALFAFAVGCPCAIAATAQPLGCAVSLQSSAPFPQFVGERIVWTATAASCGAAPVYQFSVAGPATVRAVVRDFSLDNSFAWAPMVEGVYEVSVKVNDGFGGITATSAAVSQTVDPRVTGPDAVITPTPNPLVALYSAPACVQGAMHVRFRPAGSPPDTPWTRTNTLPCVPGLSRNFVVAGMLSNTTYEMFHVAGQNQVGSASLFTTGAPPATLSLPGFPVPQGPGPGADLSRTLIYHNLASRPDANAVNLLATDLSAHLQWYYDPLASGLMAIGQPGSAPLPDGTVLLGGRDSHRTLGLNVLREIDLAGNPMRETNIDAVNAQLHARGQQNIYGFHHEFRRLPNGNIATLGWTRKTISVGGAVKQYAGDMLMVLDQNLQVVWTWDAFDHLDVTRGPTLGEICEGAPCPLTGAVDWLHENAVSWSPKDKNLLISVRTQDWVIKIAYADGTGDGHVIWRLGKGGDFAVNSSDPDPWFSHQHYPSYLDDSTLLLFDNGNIRKARDPGANSRGQVWKLDEGAMTATLEVNVDLGNYSGELGTAERMPNGNYVFNSGSQAGGGFGQSIEVLPDGTKTYVQQVAARDYRSFRLTSLYQLSTVDVVEYYNASLDHYFITWVADEIAKLDAGTVIKGWARTGYGFAASTTALSGTSPVCRYYIPPALGDSHFFGRGKAECDATGTKNPTFVLEEAAFMQMFLPTAGVCPANTTEVYRVFSNRADANHRYMTNKAVEATMIAKGWLPEGDGPNLVVMCAMQ